MISVLILTLNEKVNVGDCLDSVAWADDVLVLDSGSEDRTVEIARSKGARVMHRDFDDFASQRNYGLEEGHLHHDWVLHLDADERVTPALRDLLQDTAGRGEHRAYRIPSKLMFQGRWLKHAGMYPTYQVRFGRREALTFTQVGHGQRGALPPEQIGTLDEPLLHYAFSKGIADWVRRHNRYSSDEAERAGETQLRDVDWTSLLTGSVQARRRALKDLSYALPFRPLLRFLYVYIGCLGVLDGRPGFDYAVLLSFYEYLIGLKRREDKRRDDSGREQQPILPDAKNPEMSPVDQEEKDVA